MRVRVRVRVPASSLPVPRRPGCAEVAGSGRRGGGTRGEPRASLAGRCRPPPPARPRSSARPSPPPPARPPGAAPAPPGPPRRKLAAAGTRHGLRPGALRGAGGGGAAVQAVRQGAGGAAGHAVRPRLLRRLPAALGGAAGALPAALPPAGARRPAPGAAAPQPGAEAGGQVRLQPAGLPPRPAAAGAARTPRGVPLRAPGCAAPRPGGGRPPRDSPAGRGAPAPAGAAGRRPGAGAGAGAEEGGRELEQEGEGAAGAAVGAAERGAAHGAALPGEVRPVHEPHQQHHPRPDGRPARRGECRPDPPGPPPAAGLAPCSVSPSLIDPPRGMRAAGCQDEPWVSPAARGDGAPSPEPVTLLPGGSGGSSPGAVPGSGGCLLGETGRRGGGGWGLAPRLAARRHGCGLHLHPQRATTPPLRGSRWPLSWLRLGRGAGSGLLLEQPRSLLKKWRIKSLETSEKTGKGQQSVFRVGRSGLRGRAQCLAFSVTPVAPLRLKVGRGCLRDTCGARNTAPRGIETPEDLNP